ncbi:MAG: poly(3-hydroxybutyrate) depolymerase [Hyphomicrobium sp.]
MQYRLFSLSRSPLAAAILAVATGVLLSACEPGGMKGALPALGAKIDETSVSGISSGAYMAGQFQMAHGKIIKGAGIIAGGPYGCSLSVFADTVPGPGTEFLNLSKAINGCMLNNLSMWGVADAGTLARQAKQRAETGQIDPIADTREDRVYLFSGSSDRTVVPAIVRAAAAYYEAIGLDPQNIKLVDTLPAGHAFVTETDGGACDRTGEPYIVDCDYDQAGEILKQIYGPLMLRAAVATGDYVDFDQRPYMQDLGPNGMAPHGVVYIPKVCRAERGCRIHVAYHGCAQNRAKVGDVFIKESGFARWADTNKFIVLYPQTATTPLNPQGCWDWWGYTGRAYLTRSAPQIVAVYRMLQALGS